MLQELIRKYVAYYFLCFIIVVVVASDEAHHQLDESGYSDNIYALTSI
jgi:hypothetical protein